MLLLFFMKWEECFLEHKGNTKQQFPYPWTEHRALCLDSSVLLLPPWTSPELLLLDLRWLCCCQILLSPVCHQGDPPADLLSSDLPCAVWNPYIVSVCCVLHVSRSSIASSETEKECLANPLILMRSIIVFGSKAHLMAAISTFHHNSNLKVTTGIFCLLLNSTPSFFLPDWRGLRLHTWPRMNLVCVLLSTKV